MLLFGGSSKICVSHGYRENRDAWTRLFVSETFRHMQVYWTIDCKTDAPDPEGRLEQITSLASANPDERVLAVISSHPNGHLFRACLSLAYQIEFDESLHESLKTLSADIERQMTESEISEVEVAEKEVGNSGAISIIRPDFFSMIVPLRMVNELRKFIESAKGDLIDKRGDD